MGKIDDLKRDLGVLLDNVLEKWDRVTGRDHRYSAPELSSTLSLVAAISTLDLRLRLLEDKP